MRHKTREQDEPSLISGLGHSEGARRHHLRHYEAHGITITASRATPPALPCSTAFPLWSSVLFPLGTISSFPDAEKQTPPFLAVICSVVFSPSADDEVRAEGTTTPRGHHFVHGMGYVRTHVRVHPTETSSI